MQLTEEALVSQESKLCDYPVPNGFLTIAEDSSRVIQTLGLAISLPARLLCNVLGVSHVIIPDNLLV